MITYKMEGPGSSHAAGTDFNSLSIAEQDSVRARARLAYISFLYVENANQERYGDMKTQLANDYIMGTSNFPATLQESNKLMTNYVGTKISAPRACAHPPPVDNNITANDGLTFLIRMAHPIPRAVNAIVVVVTNIGRAPNALSKRNTKTYR